MEVNKLPQGSKILFSGIVGSQAYGLSTTVSDVDIKGVFLQSNKDILSNKYIPQIDEDSDTVYYELRRFLELVSVGNPNVLELLYLPDHCILNTSPEWQYISSFKEDFLSKECYGTFSGYARTQLKKASGLNKKFNFEKSRTERKDIIDFSKIVDRDTGKTFKVKDWLKNNGYDQSQVGLTSIDSFRDCYKLYTDDIKWANDNHRFDNIRSEDRQYRGIGDVDTNEPRTSIIEKYRNNDWKGIMYWNREEYSSHCKEYREYQKWLKNRNENRVATNKKHGQDYDGKNILHTVRLIMTAQEIPVQKKINVDRTKERNYLLNIKNGKVDLKNIIAEWSQKAEQLKELYDKSDLQQSVDKDFIYNIELKIRKNEYL
jgi:predicted nucleotidyltransferase